MIQEDDNNRKYLHSKWWMRLREGQIPSTGRNNKMMGELNKHYKGHTGQLRGGDGRGQHVEDPKVHQHRGDGQAWLSYTLSSSRTKTDQLQKDLRGPLKGLMTAHFAHHCKGGMDMPCVCDGHAMLA
jgi:hypothetical protein